MVRTCPPPPPPTQGDCGKMQLSWEPGSAHTLGQGTHLMVGTAHCSGKSLGVSFHFTSLPLSPIGLFLWPGAHIQETSLPLCLRLALLQHEEVRCLLALFSLVRLLFLQIIQVLSLVESKRRRHINLSTKRK